MSYDEFLTKEYLHSLTYKGTKVYIKAIKIVNSEPTLQVNADGCMPLFIEGSTITFEEEQISLNSSFDLAEVHNELLKYRHRADPDLLNDFLREIFGAVHDHYSREHSIATYIQLGD